MRKNYEDFINALANGTSVKDLCGQFGICKSTAYNWVKKYSLVKRTKDRTISVHKIYQLERENQTLRAENEFFRRSKICSGKIKRTVWNSNRSCPKCPCCYQKEN